LGHATVVCDQGAKVRTKEACGDEVNRVQASDRKRYERARVIEDRIVQRNELKPAEHLVRLSDGGRIVSVGGTHDLSASKRT
jgi:hypothetical protein